MNIFIISEWNERSISESLFVLTHSIKFLLMRTFGSEEDLFEEYQDCLLVLGHH